MLRLNNRSFASRAYRALAQDDTPRGALRRFILSCSRSERACHPERRRREGSTRPGEGRVHSRLAKPLLAALLVAPVVAPGPGRPSRAALDNGLARTFAAWGVDYVKEDWCHAEGLDAPTQYAKFRDALAKAGRPIVFSICEWGSNQPWEWAPQIGNLWRTTGDIQDKWASMISLLDLSSQHAGVARPGAWNDPDMLEVGNGGMTDDEYRAHFSLWAIMAAPLMAGNDVRSMSAATRDILTNPELIAVDQDSLGVQGMLVREGPPELQVWAKPLKDGARAVALLNRGDSAAKITARFDRLGLRTDSATVRDLWARADRGAFSREYAATVPAHGVTMLRVTPIRAK